MGLLPFIIIILWASWLFWQQAEAIEELEDRVEELEKETIAEPEKEMV